MSSEADADDGAGSGTASDGDGAASTDGGDGAAAGTVRTPTAEPTPEGFGRAGWLLVGAVVVCFLVVPGIIYLYPYVLGSLGLSFIGTYLMLPLIPAALLGLIAVWSMSAAT